MNHSFVLQRSPAGGAASWALPGIWTQSCVTTASESGGLGKAAPSAPSAPAPELHPPAKAFSPKELVKACGGFSAASLWLEAAASQEGCSSLNIE